MSVIMSKKPQLIKGKKKSLTQFYILAAVFLPISFCLIFSFIVSSHGAGPVYLACFPREMKFLYVGITLSL